jgi:hypothetical protein
MNCNNGTSVFVITDLPVPGFESRCWPLLLTLLLGNDVKYSVFRKQCLRLIASFEVSYEIRSVDHMIMSRVAQSVQCLITEWAAGVRSPTGAQDFSL